MNSRFLWTGKQEVEIRCGSKIGNQWISWSITRLFCMRHGFTLNGNVSSQNNRRWCCESPHALQDFPLHNFKVRVRWTPSGLSHGVLVFRWNSKFLAPRSAVSAAILYGYDLQMSILRIYAIIVCGVTEILREISSISVQELCRLSVNIFNRVEAC